MSKRNVTISKSNGTMWKCEVTDSYGITHVNYWETQEQASRWTYYIWENEEWFNSVNPQKLLANAIAELVKIDEKAGRRKIM